MAFVVAVSRIAAPADDVWAFAITPEGINDEMRPVFRMKMPRGARDLTIDNVPVGEPLGRAWMLLGGVLPVDYDDLCIAEIGPGRRFLERSSLGSMRTWQHERTVEPDGDGACMVTDRLSFEPRIPGTAGIAQRLISAFFSHRHRRLRKRYGGEAG